MPVFIVEITRYPREYRIEASNKEAAEQEARQRFSSDMNDESIYFITSERDED